MDTAVRTDGQSSSLDRETIALGVVDVGLVAALIAVGQVSHGTNPLAEPLGALEAIVPFAVGWLVVAGLAGLYRAGVADSVASTVRLTTVTWLAAANVGLILRVEAVGDTAVSPFPLVITGFGLLVLVGWRLGYAAYVTRVR